MNLPRYVLRRARTDRRLLAGATVATVIAAVVIAAAPVYLRSLEKVGVQHRLAVLGQSRTALHVNTSWLPLERAAYEESDALIDAARDNHAAQIVTGKTRFVKSRSYLWNYDGRPVRAGAQDSRSHFHLISGLERRVTYVEGRPPSPNVAFERGIPLIEVAVYAPRASILGVEVGDLLTNLAEEAKTGQVRARITGAFEITDPQNDYWLDLAVPIIAPVASVQDRLPPLPLFTAGESIIEGVGPSHGGLPASYSWFLYVDHETLGRMETGQIVSMTDAFESQIEADVVRSSLITALDNSFIDLSRRLLFARIPMFLLAALSMATVAYYLLLVGGLLAKRRSAETLMLRSRGLNYWQIVSIQSIESALLVGIPVAVAPLLAMLTVSQIGRLPVYRNTSGGGTLPVEFTWVSWLWALGAGITIFIILLAPVLTEARRRVVEGILTGEARPDSPPLFQRYFIDVLVLALGALVWWELRSRGSVVAGDLDQRSADMTLLFFPAIFLVAAALIFMRIFPAAAKGAGWLAGRTARAGLALGFWRLGRSPYWYTWPVILIVLATGLGVMSGAIASTLERSNRERISFATAADLRITPGNSNYPANAYNVALLESHDAVLEATPVYRTDGRIGTTGSGAAYALVAVDPEEFSAVSWFREDFAELTLPAMLDRIHVEISPQTIQLPTGTRSLAIWAKATPKVENTFLWIAMRGANGAMDTVTFGQLEGEWTRMTASMGSLPEPIELVSIQVFEPAGPDSGVPFTMLIDDLVAIQSGGSEQSLLDFELEEFWTGLPTSEGFDTHFSLVPEDEAGRSIGPFKGSKVAKVSLGRGINAGIRGIYRSTSEGPIPVIASRGFDARTQTPEDEPFVVEINGQLAPVKVVGTVDMFPTIHPRILPYLIADINALQDFLSIRIPEPFQPNEALVSAVPGREEEAEAAARQVFGIANIQNRNRLLERSLIDPLVVAGWRGMGFITIAIALAAVGLGYLTYITAHEGRTRNESAFILALGFTRRSFLLLTLIEHALVALMGAALGVAAGVAVSRITVSSIAHTQAGGELVPPFVLETNWIPAILVITAVALITAAAIVTLRRAYPKLPVHELTSARG